MLSYMLPGTGEEKPPAGDPSHQLYRPLPTTNSVVRYSAEYPSTISTAESKKTSVTRTTSFGTIMFGRHHINDNHHHQPPRPGSAAPLLPPDSPKHNGHQHQLQQPVVVPVMRKSTLHNRDTNSKIVVKDESLYSIDSDASTIGSERKGKVFNGPAKHANLKRYIYIYFYYY